MPPFPQYGQQGPMYNANNPSMVPNLQQLQYQQNMLQRGAPPMNNFFPPGMQAGFGGYNAPGLRLTSIAISQCPTEARSNPLVHLLDSHPLGLMSPWVAWEDTATAACLICNSSKSSPSILGVDADESILHSVSWVAKRLHDSLDVYGDTALMVWHD
ncbi:hypothetical protein PG987_003201 [Apiospora arundinis]